jgi:hypothetical protein
MNSERDILTHLPQWRQFTPHSFGVAFASSATSILVMAPAPLLSHHPATEPVFRLVTGEFALASPNL